MTLETWNLRGRKLLSPNLDSEEKRDGSRDPISYFTPYYNTWKGETGLSNEDNDALN